MNFETLLYVTFAPTEKKSYRDEGDAGDQKRTGTPSVPEGDIQYYPRLAEVAIINVTGEG